MKPTFQTVRFRLDVRPLLAPLLFSGFIASPAILCSHMALAQPLPERRAISGRITRSDGTPVSKATITLQRENDIGPAAFWGNVTATDERGFFSFPDAEDGSYLISAEAESYAPIQNKPLSVSENSAVWNARLDRLATVSLRLLGADGAPLKEVRATVRLSRNDSNGQPLRRQTDAAGTITLRDNTPGRYALEVSAPGGGFASLRNVEIQFLDKPQALDVPLQRGGNLSIVAHDANDPAQLLGGATLSLSATLNGDEERKAGQLGARTVANLQSLYAYSSDGSGAVTRDGDGTLRLRDLPPGRYRAKLVLPAYAPSETREVEVKAGQDAALDISLQPQVKSSTLKVLLRGKDNQPLANREWTLQLRSLGPASVQAQLDGAAGLANGEIADLPPEVETFGVLARRARSDNKGQLSLFPVRAGRWRVLAFPSRDDTGRVQSIAQRDVNVADDGAEVTLNFSRDVK